MNHAWKLVCMFALVFSLAFFPEVSSSVAQTAATGQIAGTVTDPSKAAIASATVTVTNEATAQARTTKTNADGDFVVPLLPPGNYSVAVAAAGFRTQTSTHVSVDVATTATVNIRLQLGEA